MASNNLQYALNSISALSSPSLGQVFSNAARPIPVVFAAVQQPPRQHSRTPAFNIDVEALLWLPEWHVYWKDLEGRFLGCNDHMAESISLVSRHTIAHKTDYDLPISKADADSFRRNDLDATKKETAIEYQEFAVVNKAKTTFISLKTALRNQDGIVVGTLGLTRILHQEQDSLLTPRQEECLCYLVYGLSIKQIAQKMALSPKTVEHYLDSIKNKLTCETRADLIRKALSLPSVKQLIQQA